MDDIRAAEAKSDAHAGLSDALEYGRISARRVNGVDYVYAREDDGATFEIRFDSYGRAHCRGFACSSTNRDLARDALLAAHEGRTHLN